MYLTSEILGVIAELYTLELLLQGMFLPRNKSKWYWVICYGILGTGLMFLSLFPNASFWRLGLSLVGISLLSHVLFETKVFQAIYSSAVFVGLYIMTEMVIMTLLKFAGINSQEIMTRSSARMVCGLITHLTLLFITMLVIIMTKRKRSAITLPFLIALAPGCVSGILLGALFCQKVQQGNEPQSLPYLIAAAALLYMNIMTVFYAERAKRSADRQKQLELAEHHYAMQEQYYTDLRCQQEETRAMFHDINKYMLAMQALADESNVQKASEVLDEAQTLFGSLEKVVDVGNPTISIILNEYKTAAEEADIPFRFDVSIPPELTVSAIDAYVIMGNTLDNAIEACSVLPTEKRYIQLQIRMFHNILFYQISNPYSQEKAPKKQGNNHGYGLQNVRRCVNKYHGDMSITQDNGVFTLSIRLSSEWH